MTQDELKAYREAAKLGRYFGVGGEALTKLLDSHDNLTAELARVKAELDILRGVNGVILKARDAALNRSEALARAVMADMGNSREPLTSAQITKLVNDFFAENRNKPPTPELIVRAVEKMHGIGVDAAREG